MLKTILEIRQSLIKETSTRTRGETHFKTTSKANQTKIENEIYISKIQALQEQTLMMERYYQQEIIENIK